ncbi:MAG TPA: polysaccharide deacetylase family protein [Vicinamibacterales bacterium]|nr:polysaccharide deacetylase family protein [Vicinamibacterales bacterium]
MQSKLPRMTGLHSMVLSALVMGTVFLPVIMPVPQKTATRAVAVTFDDLPATHAGVVVNQPTNLEELTRRLLTAVRKYNVPAVGFVNEDKLFIDGAAAQSVNRRIGLLKMWLDAGLELGNHTYSHRDLNTTSIEQFQTDLLRGETITRELLKARGMKLRYFRHPFLHVGSDLTTRRAFEAFLAKHDYVVAPVTVDNDDFVYAAAYAQALGPGEAARADRIADDYLRYMEEVFSFFEDVSRRVTGREIPQILLLHANTLNADRFASLAEALVRRGYRFVSLAAALEDPAYRLPDQFVGAPGNSWFNHWEITAGRKPVPTPSPPKWITTR